MKKNVIKTVIFLLVFLILLYFTIKILWLKATPISYFYNEPNNSLDIIYIGGSNAYAHFNTVLAYNLYGYTTGLLSADSQPFPLVKHLIEESEKYQTPSLYIIDLAKVVDMDSFTGEEMRKTTDSMKFSKNRIDAINETLKYKSDISKDEYINYYFSFLMYHNCWKNVYHNLIDYKNLYKGYLFDQLRIVTEPQTQYVWNEEIIELTENNRMVLNDLINYIKQEKLNVLFVVPIRAYEEEKNKKINQVVNIIQYNDLKVINFNILKDFDNIDFRTDFYNSYHLNIYGATKYTLYFAKYLKENYELEDHREDKQYTSWDKEYERLKKDYKKITNKNFEDLLVTYNN